MMKLKITDHIDGNAVRVAELEGEDAEAAYRALSWRGPDTMSPLTWVELKSLKDPSMWSRFYTQSMPRVDCMEAAKECAALATALVGETLHSDVIALDWEDWSGGGTPVDKWPEFTTSEGR